MSAQTLLLVVVAAIVALGLALFKYFFKEKRAKINMVLAFLRFLAFFGLFLLLINPKLEKEELSLEKSNLILLFDNSTSIESLGGRETSEELFSKLKSDEELLERFALNTHLFGNAISDSLSLDFSEDLTNISKVIKNLREVYGTTKSSYVLVTDGNQNIGADYEYLKLNQNSDVLPIVVGDTTKYEDLYLSNINVNKYTFLNNQFPFEATVIYNGNSTIDSQLHVFLNGEKVYQEAVQLSDNNNSQTITGLIEATAVGLKTLRFQLVPLDLEKNVVNNQKEVAIEVIDEQTKVAIVSSVLHPDLGVLKKSIENNEQRLADIVKPNLSREELGEYDFYVLYQPNRSFKTVFDLIENKRASSFVITGTQTDWRYLNSAQNAFSKESFNQTEEILPLKNEAYKVFDISNFLPENFPPLTANLGELKINVPYEPILWQQIKGVNLDAPLLFSFENQGIKKAVLIGENIWQWRIQDYRENRNFDAFDTFVEKLMRYLSDSRKRNRLEINYEPIFASPSMAMITASYFDEAYNFKPEVNLVLGLNGAVEAEIPMLLKSNAFEADLSSLQPGEYEFSVFVKDENISRSGRFKILDFKLEDQLVSANAEKLQRFAENNGGQLFYPSEIHLLKEKLLQEERYIPVQKSIKNVVSLIDYKMLLIVIAVSLALEWFVRKYNGLI